MDDMSRTKPSRRWDLGLNNGLPPSTLTEEQASALWDKHGQMLGNTRQSWASQIVSSRKASESQLPMKDESSKSD